MQSENKSEIPENDVPGDATAENANSAQDAEASATADGAATDDATPPPDDAEVADGTGADAEPAGPSVEAELAETKDRLLRALAEAENVRRRASRDVENASKRAIAGFAREMVVVADNLSRALSSVDSEKFAADPAVKSMLEGVEMTAREMQNAFSRNGIKKVDPLGERFDPQHHEAMFEFEDLSKPAGLVGQVMEPGYTLHDQPLRPAKVGVTKGGQKPGSGPTPSQQTLDEAAAEKSGSSGGSAYEKNSKPSGTNIDEEL